ncbi:immediate early response 3-interacting protein 1 [Prorops nasuta]|uniref:immediate early response 3-interacting protein 1 n=1 Tax=Prorops nasuta TaxID=863751 RepID=UPI0034D013FB
MHRGMPCPHTYVDIICRRSVYKLEYQQRIKPIKVAAHSLKIVTTMAFTLWNLLEATILCLNAVCVLNEERFLAKVGWASWQNVQGFGEPPSAKSQMLNLLRSIRTVARVPLIFLNILLIVIKLVLG